MALKSDSLKRLLIGQRHLFSRMTNSRAVLIRCSNYSQSGRNAPGDVTPEMPLADEYTKAACNARREWLEKCTNTDLQYINHWWPEGTDFSSEDLSKHIERPIGTATVPLAVAGPMLFHGEHANGWIMAPMATTEGALVASVCRGAKAITMSGGVKTSATQQRMSVSPMFLCASPSQALTLGDWVTANKERIQTEVVSNISDIAQLKEIIPAFDMEACHTLLRFETGDYDGQELTRECAAKVVEWVKERARGELGVQIRLSHIEGNLSGSKSLSQFNALIGRGISASAEVEIPENVLQEMFYITSEKFTGAMKMSVRISERIGQQAGFNVNTANILGAMFTALGQDVSCVHECAISRFGMEALPQESGGGIRATMYIPSLVVGTMGGGTSLPTQRESLEIMGCYGEGKVRKLAEVITAFCLALDLSTYSAVSAGYFAEAHDKLGRNRPDEK